jgi:hypothetical protein
MERLLATFLNAAALTSEPQKKAISTLLSRWFSLFQAGLEEIIGAVFTRLPERVGSG